MQHNVPMKKFQEKDEDSICNTNRCSQTQKQSLLHGCTSRQSIFCTSIFPALIGIVLLDRVCTARHLMLNMFPVGTALKWDRVIQFSERHIYNIATLYNRKKSTGSAARRVSSKHWLRMDSTRRVGCLPIDPVSGSSPP